MTKIWPIYEEEGLGDDSNDARKHLSIVMAGDLGCTLLQSVAGQY